MISDAMAQGVGLLASALVICAFLNKNDKSFKIIIMFGTSLFAFHFFLLGAYAGAVVAVLNTIRTFFSMKFHNSNRVLFGFLTVYLGLAFFLPDKPYDLLPIISGACSTFALYKLSGIKLRLCTFGIEFMWLTYSIIIKSIGGLITNIFVLSANALTVFRLARDKKRADA